MEGPIQVPLKLNRLSFDVPGGGGDMRLASGSRSNQGRADSGNPLHRRRQKAIRPAVEDVHRGSLRCSAPSAVVSATLSAGGSAAVEPVLPREREEQPSLRSLRAPGCSGAGGATAAAAALLNGGGGVAGASTTAAAPVPGSGPAAGPLFSHGGESQPQPQSLEEYVLQDLEAFWRWCPTPVDGLHRCGLLVKLFDYCGLTRKENKIANKVRRLDVELRALGVLATDQIEAHQRVQYEAFVQSRRLKEAILRCSEIRNAWEQRRRVGKCAEGRTPLALWVLNVISVEAVNNPETPKDAASHKAA